MDKQKLLNQVQAAKDNLDEANFRKAGDERGYGYFLAACAQLAEVLELVIPAIEETNARIDRLAGYTEALADRIVERIDD